jgi:hypothetical protein
MRIIILLVLLTDLVAHSQEIKFDKITKEELLEEEYALDPSADAVVLKNSGILKIAREDSFGWMYRLYVRKRIKIYNKDGYPYGSVRIPIYVAKKHNRETVKNLKAVTYNLEGDKIKATKVDKKKISITEDISSGWDAVTFTFPNIEEGSVLEYSYLIESPYVEVLPEWRFQDIILVKESVYEFIFLRILGYNERFKGYQKINKAVEEIKYYNAGMANGNAMKYIYTARNVPKITEESFVNNYDNYISSVQHELAVVKTTETGKFAEFTTSWEKVDEKLKKSIGFGTQLDKYKYYKPDLEKIVNNDMTVTQKIDTVFQFVKDNIKWNEYVGIYCSQEAEETYEKGQGNVADINLMLTSMLRHVGLDANPVILSTISKGFPPSIPSTHFYNYIISSVNLDNGNVIFLDATDQFSTPNVLPTRCLNFNGILLKKDDFPEKIDLFPKYLSQQNNVMNVKIYENGNIHGKLRRRFSKHFGYKFRSDFREIETSSYIEGLENSFNISVEDYDCKFKYAPAKPIVETIAFTSTFNQDIINGDIYVSPLFFFRRENNPFREDTNERKLPLNFTFPRSKKHVVTIEIPEGYEISYIPENYSNQILDNRFSYSYTINKINETNLQFLITQNINTSVLGVENYGEVKAHYEKILNKETEKIVLKKL